MSHLHKIAGRVMGEFNSFKGSRPALDNGELLVVRSVCQGDIDIHNEVDEKLDNLVKELNGREVNVISDEAGKIINKMDEQVRTTVKINETADSNGVIRMAHDLEQMGLTVKYRLFRMEHADVFVVLWKDKNNNGPCFIETTISDEYV
ncbi:MAG: DUF2120 domain-containing protein [Methanobrevibacter sp.]